MNEYCGVERNFNGDFIEQNNKRSINVQQIDQHSQTHRHASI